MVPAPLVTNTRWLKKMNKHITMLCLMLCSFCTTVHAQDDAASTTDVFPTLVRDAMVNSNRIGKKTYWVIGVEHATRPVEQTYVVMVPGSEGAAGRYEQRTRSVPMNYPIPHRYAVEEVVFTDINGKNLDRESTAAAIAKSRCFLFVAAGKTVTKADREIFSDALVLVTPVVKR